MSAKTIQIEEIQALAEEILVRDQLTYPILPVTADLQDGNIPSWKNVLDIVNDVAPIEPIEILVPSGTVLFPSENPYYTVNILADYPLVGLHPKTNYGAPYFDGIGNILRVEYREFCKYDERRTGDGTTLQFLRYYFDNIELDGSDYKTTQDYIIIISK